MRQRTGFLDLPREIRDQIYNYVLISPTSLVEAVYPSSSSSSSSTSTPSTRFLKHKRPSPSRLTIITSTRTYSVARQISEYTLPSLSICRVSRQIHHETSHIFWANNALFTSHPFNTIPSHPSLLKTLKVMGQSASRLITQIVILMPELHGTYRWLSQLFQSLNSRARRGDFKRLELHWEGVAWDDLVWTHHCAMVYGEQSVGKVMHMNQVLTSMRGIGEVSRYKMVVYLPGEGEGYSKEGSGLGEELGELYKRQLTADIGEALRDEVYWGDRLVWEGGKMVEGAY